MCSTSLFVFNFKYGYDINATTSSFKELFKEFIDLFLPYFKLICLVAYSLCILKTASDIVEDAEIFMKINNNFFIDFIYSTTNVLGNLFLILSFGCIIVLNLIFIGLKWFIICLILSHVCFSISANIFIKVTDKIVVNQTEYMNLKKED